MIEFEQIFVQFEAGRALSDVNLTVEPGALCVLVGPSGGKSTLLRLVNGMVRPAAGRVLVRGVDVADLDPAPLPTFDRLRDAVGRAVSAPNRRGEHRQRCPGCSAGRRTKPRRG